MHNKVDHLTMETKHKVQENIDNIGKLFPNTVTEIIKGYNGVGEPILQKAIDFDILRQELSEVLVEGPAERYQMNWPDKRKSILLANTPTNTTLRPCREESVDFDNTENLYIEGNNLEVLKLLQETYLNKVKMIYIDPPYNTGNDSFVYDDNFKVDEQTFSEMSGKYDKDGNIIFDIKENNENNGKFHTDWLNMIYPRLKIAKDLLNEQGVILISIDDRELYNVMKICDEIFGKTNFLANCIWISGRTSAAHFTHSHEYVVIYAKNKEMLPLFQYNGNDVITDRTIKKPGNKNPLSCIEFPAGIEFECEDKVFANEIGNSEPVYVEKGVFECKNGRLNNPVTLKAAWAMKDMIARWLRGEEVYDQKGQKVKRFYFKSNGVLQYEKEKGTIHPNTIIEDITTKSGSSLLKEIFGKEIFDFPKPIQLLKYFSAILGKNDIIVDFFSGSATTAHAVLNLNSIDGGKRKFIMVQLPEETAEKSEAYRCGYNNICEIGKERIRRAGQKIKEENPDTTQNLDIGFRVLKLDSSNMKEVYYKPSEYTQAALGEVQENIKSDRTSEDLLFQVMLELGELLSSDIEEKEIADKQVFVVGQGNIVACFDTGITDEVVTAIAKMQPYYAVFRDSSIATDSVAANFEQIFATYSPSTIKKVL